MALEATVKDLESVDEKFRGLYKKLDDGTFSIDLEGPKELKARVDEFRQNNIAYRKELEDLKQKLQSVDGIDPEKYKQGQEALETLEKQADKKLIDEGKIDEVVSSRTERMRQDYEGKIKALEESHSKMKEQNEEMLHYIERSKVEVEASTALNSVGMVKKGAMGDLINRALGTWRFDAQTKQISPVGSDGKTIYGKDPQTIMTMKEWAEQQLVDAPFLFEANTGGESKGNVKPGPEGKGMVDMSDPMAMGRNAEQILKGEVVVNPV